jgi:signal transduction histidine kinase
MPETNKDECVIIIAPLGQDAEAMAALLQIEGIETCVCGAVNECCAQLKAGVGTLVLTEEALESPQVPDLLHVLQNQPAWSEVPLIILTSGGESRVEKLLDLIAAAAGTVTLLERPLSARTLIRSVEVALRSRRRQYQVRDLIEQLSQVHEDLRQQAETLEQTVVDRTARLNETVQDLEAFSYSIAHDMRSPLRAMQGFSQILMMDYGTRLDAGAKMYLERISTSANRLDQLIQDVLNYSRVVRIDLPLTPVNTEKLLEEIIESYPNLHRDKIEIVKPLPVIEANSAALTQVFSNLLGNAFKFVRPDVEPRVKIWAERISQNPSTVRFWFEDNGIGMAPESSQRIFQIFQRLNITENYEGTGIGLAIVRKAVERMRGQVGVNSELGKGSRFWVELNASDA